MTTQPDPKAMQDAIDKIEIAEMQSRYMFALDWADPNVYGSLFTEDAVLSWPEGHAEGRDAIAASCKNSGAYRNRVNEAEPALKAARLRHFVTNQVIRIENDRATARAYWFDFHNDNQQRWPYIPAYGHYEDELIRTAEGWRFSSRRVYNETTDVSPTENPAW